TSPAPTPYYPLSLHDALPISRLAEHRPAGVAGIDHRVGLEELRQREVLGDRIGGPARADDPRAQRITKTVGRAYDEDWIADADGDRKSTRLNSSHDQISYAVF